MKIDKVHPQLRKVYQRIPAVPFHNRFFVSVLQFASRFQRKPKSMHGVDITDHAIGTASVRVYRPKGDLSGAGMLWVHGGGYVIGDASVNDRECALYAKNLRIVVVSVDYRLAPKYPFPCAMDDCVDAWQWLLEHANDLGVEPQRIVISGQSAGGGLAAGLVQRVYDNGGVQPAGQALFCPMIDDRTAAHAELDAVKHRLWNNRNNRGAWGFYLGQPAGLSAAPAYAAPARREDLSGLPVSWIGVGDIDLFYQEDCDYAARLNAAGVSCEVKIVPGAPHGFELLVPDAPITRDFYESNYQFLTKVLGL